MFVPFSGEVPKEASSEYRVHFAVYKKSAYKAIVHAHPRTLLPPRLWQMRSVPLDSEGIMFCPLIPVTSGAPGTQGLADAVAGIMQHHKLVIARGHGTFAGGATLDEAFQLTSLAEHACRILAFRKMFL